MRNCKKFNSRICLLIIFFIGISVQGWAQEKFPNQPVKIIVPFEPGGGMDLNTRMLQPHFEKALGQPVVIINKGGAGGSIGFNEGAKAIPDGYTVTLLNTSLMTVPYTVNPEINYRNYEPIILTGSMPGDILVRADAPWKSLKEFLDYAKANPGKIRVAHSGHGGSQHIRTVGIELAAGVKFTQVPYKGAGPARAALLGGHVEATSSSSSESIQLIKGGAKLRMLAITASERMSEIPDVPTFKELGIDFVCTTWFTYGVPKGTPKERIKILHDAFRKAKEAPGFIKYEKDEGITSQYLGAEDVRKFWEKEDRLWSKMVEAAGIKIVK